MYSLEEIKDLYPKSSIISVSDNLATIELQMEKSSNLTSWEEIGNPTRVTIPADEYTKFYRFKNTN